MAGEVIQRGIEAPRRLRSARTVVRLLATVLLAGASVAIDCAAQSNGPPPNTSGPVAVPVTAGVKVDARQAE